MFPRRRTRRGAGGRVMPWIRPDGAIVQRARKRVRLRVPFFRP